MKRPAYKNGWLFAIAAVVLAGVALLVMLPSIYLFLDDEVFGPSKGLFNRTFRTPAVVRAAFVEEIDPRRAQAQVEKLMTLYRSRTGSYGLRRTVVAMEGGNVSKFVATENGKLTFIVDLTRFKEGSRGFAVAHPSGISPVTAAQNTSRGVLLSENARMYVVCTIAGRGSFF
ncbi:MAG TPA: hypothetical protein VFD66_13600 [Verrucomicrobiae bacterium]|nr:hypothetical protein [Verrucomicrobiae bacterium]